MSTTVLITGANRGLGLEFAKQYKKLGYEVIGTARRLEEAEELKALGIRVEPLDVTQAGSVRAFAKKIQGTPIDLLINNAGVFRERGDQLEELELADMNLSFAANANGPLLVTQALLPQLRQGKGKKVVHITSFLGSIAENTGGMYFYRASKAALNMIAKTMSLDLGKEGFTVITLHPGWVRTEMGGPSAPLSTEESIGGMIRVISTLDPSKNGLFLDYRGNEVAW